MSKIVYILISRLKIDQIGSNLIKLDQTCSNLFKLDPIGSNLSKMDQIGSNLSKMDQTWQNLLTKPVDKTCWHSMLTKHVEKIRIFQAFWTQSRIVTKLYFFDNIWVLYFVLFCFYAIQKVIIFKVFFLKIATFFQKKPNFE